MYLYFILQIKAFCCLKLCLRLENDTPLLSYNIIKNVVYHMKVRQPNAFDSFNHNASLEESIFDKT